MLKTPAGPCFTYITKRCTRLPLLTLAAVALAAAASAQNPLERYPQNYKQILDKPQFSIIRVHYGPNEYVGVHDHSDFPTLFVYLNNSGAVRFRQEGVPPSTMVRPPARPGAFRYSPGGVERHSVQNLSDTSSEFLRIELKQFPLEGGEASRHNPPETLSADSTAREFSNDQIEVDRVICMPGHTCAVSADSLPSLLIALSPVRLSGASDSAGQSIDLGEVKWIEARQPVTVSASGTAPAHLLRVLVKSQRPATPVN